MFDLFSDFFDSFDLYPVYYEEKMCPQCKLTYSQLQKRGRMGCEKCYETFRKPIEETVRQLNQKAVHTGKIPSSCAGEINKKKRYDELKKQIAQAVSSEDYEKAAVLHRELKELGGDE